jgi:hypothetical protein
VDANYVLKTCGPLFDEVGRPNQAGNPNIPDGAPRQMFKAGMYDDTICGDPTGQTDCATKCFEDLYEKEFGAECRVEFNGDDCVTGYCGDLGERDICRDFD